MHLHVHPHFAAAKTWIARVLLEDLLGLSVTLVFEQTATHYTLVLPNGRKVILEDHFFCRCTEDEFPATAFLPGQPLRLSPPAPGWEELTALYGQPVLRQEGDVIHCGLDLWASAFFMLSRWEEHAREQDGRFPAEQAYAVQHGLIHRPLVNEYAAFLRNCFQSLGVNVPYPRTSARLQLSCDVDHPRLWRRPADRLRTLAGSVLRRFNPAELGYWLAGPAWNDRDPFDVFDAWMEMAGSKGLRWQFNFLAGREAAPDCDYNLNETFMQDLLHKIHDQGHVIGFHPSRMAAADKDRFMAELEALQAAAPVPVRSGRHHFLHFKIPDTWRWWAEAGLEWDGSLGYAEQEGFRCGIAQPYQVFDIERQCTLPVWERPLIVMDVTLARYRRHSPVMALSSMQSLAAETKKHGGEFNVLWHNSSWNTYFWAPWQEVLLQTMHQW